MCCNLQKCFFLPLDDKKKKNLLHNTGRYLHPDKVFLLTSREHPEYYKTVWNKIHLRPLSSADFFFFHLIVNIKSSPANSL